ncbi:MAG: enoyl-CoA hydratase [Rhodospirillaceae bacterium]|nr:enoyl-CoA hydratase [Rhodospirillaceae bacterium]
MEPEILFSRISGIGRVLLNRPKALNALTHQMCDALETRLRAWAADETVKAVVIRGAGERAFCAGGDIRRLYDAGKTGDDYPYRFWADEYRLDALIKHYAKPYLALLDGITMGGGVGMSVHGSHRLVTEHALFAMPETGIGLFPDVGGSYFLPRCPGRIGLYLGLTGERLRAADLLYSGIATHYVPRARLDALEEALAAAPGEVDAVLARFAGDPGPATLAGQRDEIDRLFAGSSLDTVLADLAAEGSTFSRRALDMLATKSPTALRLTFRQLQEGARLGFDDCMRMEWRMVSHVPRHMPDFYEGVRAAIIDKDNRPQWSPPRLADVDEAMIDRFFAAAPKGELALY